MLRAVNSSDRMASSNQTDCDSFISPTLRSQEAGSSAMYPSNPHDPKAVCVPVDVDAAFPWTAGAFGSSVSHLRFLPEGVLAQGEETRNEILQNIVRQEQSYLDQLDAWRRGYRNVLWTSESSVIPEKRREQFIHDVFGKVESIWILHEYDMLPSCCQYLEPRTLGLGDFFRAWIRKARGPYLDYAVNYPLAAFAMHREIRRNPWFAKFCEKARGPYTAWDNCMWAPCTRLAFYIEQLERLQSTWYWRPEEMRAIGFAIEEMQAVAKECHHGLGKMLDRTYLLELRDDLTASQDLTPAISELELTHPDRALIHEGELGRLEEGGPSWIESYGILLDHFFIIATARRTPGGWRSVRVQHAPMLLEGIMCNTIEGPAEREVSVWKTTTGELEAKEVYPFRITSSRGISLVLSAPTQDSRTRWCQAITATKQKHPLLGEQRRGQVSSFPNAERPDLLQDNEESIVAIASKIWEVLRSLLADNGADPGQKGGETPIAAAIKVLGALRAGPVAAVAELSRHRELIADSTSKLWVAFRPAPTIEELETGHSKEVSIIAQNDPNQARNNVALDAIKALAALRSGEITVAQLGRSLEGVYHLLQEISARWANEGHRDP